MKDSGSSRAADPGSVKPRRQALADLLASVEAASGPDRELDGRIGCWAEGYTYIAMADGKRTWADYGDASTVGARSIPAAGFVIFEPAAGTVKRQAFTPSRYTASLDAALALVNRVLPGWTTDVHTADASAETYPIRKAILIYDDGSCEVTISYCHPKIELRDIGEGYHESGAPLAVCAALLKALLASEASEPTPRDELNVGDSSRENPNV